ncbi:MAG: TlyA family RNA methyltransferase [Myxococcales bacterium]|nr:TlyA family RNA methyltransferase [Myxococcales bacterium]MBL0195786.1 TlyA family RNA methyltransferase [Myxococcales bacterium]
MAIKVRIDQRMVQLGLADSRTRAQALLLAGVVEVRGQRVDKAGTLVPADAEVRVRGADHPFVSRGGVKLEGALATLGVDVTGLRCLDLGASTGGFTDCLLQRGAARVVAVDVGYGQLAQKLRDDPRVDVHERTNARSLTAALVGGEVDLTVVDASFIGLGKLMPAIALCTRAGGQLVALVKPQFEVGRAEASRGRGVVRDPSARSRAIAGASDDVSAAGFELLGTCDCAIRGPKGNLEAFVHARRTGAVMGGG